MYQVLWESMKSRYEKNYASLRSSEKKSHGVRGKNGKKRKNNARKKVQIAPPYCQVFSNNQKSTNVNLSVLHVVVAHNKGHSAAHPKRDYNRTPLVLLRIKYDHSLYLCKGLGRLRLPQRVGYNRCPAAFFSILLFCFFQGVSLDFTNQAPCRIQDFSYIKRVFIILQLTLF